MKHLKHLTSLFAFSFVLLIGCKKEVAPESSGANNELQTQSKASVKPSNQITADLQQKLIKLRASLPAGYEKRMKLDNTGLPKLNQEYRDLVRRATAVEPTPCNSNTPISLWLDEQLADWDAEIFELAIITGMLDFPTYDALLFVNSSANQTYGVDGEFTHQVIKGFKDLKRFWNIQSDNIVLGAIHGSMLRDRERVIRIDMILFGDDRETAEFWADLILTLLDEVPQYRNGDHPIFTFNAFAFDGGNTPWGTIPPKIILGDGVLEGYEAIGYGDVAPQAILAHEYGHHIQFQLNLFTTPRTPEGTRRTELMADAFAAYYLSHARGASMQWKRVKQFLQVFFNVGDCAFTNDNHHGTPTQRMAAAEWGYQVADNAQKQGHILTAQQFVTQFEAKLPQLINQ